MRYLHPLIVSYMRRRGFSWVKFCANTTAKQALQVRPCARSFRLRRHSNTRMAGMEAKKTHFEQIRL